MACSIDSIACVAIRSANSWRAELAAGVGELEARLLGHQQVDQQAEHARLAASAWPFSPVPLPPAMKTRSGTSGCVLWASCSATSDKRVQPRVAERLDLAEQDRRLGQADLQDARAFAAAGQDALLALGLRP